MTQLERLDKIEAALTAAIQDNARFAREMLRGQETNRLLGLVDDTAVRWEQLVEARDECRTLRAQLVSAAELATNS